MNTDKPQIIKHKIKNKDTNITALQQVEVVVVKEEVEEHDEDPLSNALTEFHENVFNSANSAQPSDENIVVKKELEIGPTVLLAPASPVLAPVLSPVFLVYNFANQLGTSSEATPVPSPTKSSDVQSLPPPSWQPPAKRLKSSLHSQDDAAATACSRKLINTYKRIDLNKERLRLRDKEIQLEARCHETMESSRLGNSSKAVPVSSPMKSSDLQSVPSLRLANRLKRSLPAQDDVAATALSGNVRKSYEKMDLEKEWLKLRDKELQLEARWHEFMKESLNTLRDIIMYMKE